MVLPVRAVVCPRVFIGGSDAQLRLDDEIRERLDRGAVGLIQLAGPPGCGASAALAHLAFVFSDDSRLQLADDVNDDRMAAIELASRHDLVVFAAANGVRAPQAFERWVSAPWTRDAWIEYLLAAHHDHCGSVMRRVLANEDRHELAWLPLLWRPVLDLLAGDDSMTDLRTAVRLAVTSRLAQPGSESTARFLSFSTLCDPKTRPSGVDKSAIWAIGAEALYLLRHPFAQRLFAAEYLAGTIESDRCRKELTGQLPKPLIEETARQIATRPEALARLEQIVSGWKRAGQPMAASLLHAAIAGWSPKPGRAPLLVGAYLDRVAWRGIRLKRLCANKADLMECDLIDAQINGFCADSADLTKANLHGAKINDFSAVQTQLVGADLSSIRAPNARLSVADLRRANLEGALLKGAKLCLANLADANLRRADLSRADLTDAQVAGADFSGADLTSANLSRLALYDADFSGVRFSGAILCSCDLEGMTLPGAQMDAANLQGAYLTGTRMPNANLRGANLTGAGLAEIDWEQADLRGADLRGCTFHMGSSRSGLVGSPIACEGSRTGFYTDELNEQDFKSPEEIRKANLRGSDLRGAKLFNVDFYLVDVRDCLYTPEQQDQLRRTGAILETRV